MRTIITAVASLCAFLTIGCASLAPPTVADANVDTLTVPFDDHRDQVAVTGLVQGEDLIFLLDTAVTPSVIDLETAQRLGFPIDRSAAEDAQGVGSDRAQIFPAEIRGLSLQGRAIPPATAAALDMSLLATRYGKPLHGVLGQSFLEGRRLLIDYPNRLVHFLAADDDVERLVQSCGKRYRTPLVRYRSSTAPLVQVRIAGTSVPATLDTGGSGTIEFMEGALPGDILAQVEGRGRDVRVTGARGDARESEVTLPVAVHLGPFRFDDLRVTVSDRTGSPETRLANIGNALLQQFRLFLDYENNELGLFADCSS